MQEVKLKYLTTKMKALKEHHGSSTILFLGAGVSKSAGIPLASEIMKQIEENEPFKTYIQGCEINTYASYMNCLSARDRRNIFNDYISKSRINTSHLYAAQLIAEGYVDCVVTTNFDTIMLKSLALFNIIPSIYDLTIARDNITSNFEFPAVIYMHGQNYGFWQLNTEHELELPVNAIRNAITKISMARAWVVIGYSGNDPVLNQLASIDSFAEGLFWVCYKNDDPNEKVRNLLLDKNTNGSRFIKGYNSDDFFRQLKIELGMDEPQIIRKPFTQLLNAISNIQPVIIDDKEVDLCSETRKQIEQAIKGFELKEGFENKPEISKNQIEEDELLRKVKEIYNSANYQDITNYETDIKKSSNTELIKYYSFVYWGWGWSIGNIATEKSGDEKEKFLLESIEKYKQSIKISPDFSGPYNNLGLMLGYLAELKSGNERAKLLSEGIKKYEKAIELEPNYADAYLNLGWALGNLADLKIGEDKEKLLWESIEKYKQAIEINPNDNIVYDNWGWALSEIAILKTGDEKEKLLWESIEKCKMAIKINPNFYKSYDRWGWTLGEIASLKTGDEKEKLLKESKEKYNKAKELGEDK
jgi:tetratricopeptide (TPR) repeat protein